MADQTYPNAPGYKRDGTSKEAAASVAARAKTIAREVYKSLMFEGPATADEIAIRLRMDRLSIRPRLTELQTRKLIEPTGDRRKNASGKSAMVWRIIPA